MQQQNLSFNHHPSQMAFHPQSHPQTPSHFPGHFQLSEPQAQALAQTRYAHAHAQRQAQAAHAKFQAQLQNASTNPNIVMSPNSSSAASGTAKRSGQRPPSRPSGSSNANTSGLFKMMELTPAVAPKKRKQPENGLPKKLAAILPESALYTQLLEYEARVDSLLARKKIEVQESTRNPSYIRKVLRIYVFHTFTNQMQTDTKKDGDPPSWSLKITGRILEDGSSDPLVGVGGVTQNADPSFPKFSSFFKKVTIYLDKSLYPDNHVISWASSRSPSPNEGFEVKRKGDKEFIVLVRLELNNVPEKFKLSPGLAEILGLEADTRPRILWAIWHYVKTRRLQSFADPSFFTCDPPLQKLFGEEKMKFTTLAQKLSQHLTAPQPIPIEHKIKLSGNSPSGSTCYDVLVDLPITLHEEASATIRSMENHKEFDVLDGQISASIRKMREHQRRRAFFLSFSQSPAEFIDALLASQGRDLKLAAGDASRDEEKEQHSDFYNQSWAEDAVIRYLNRKSGGDGPGNS